MRTTVPKGLILGYLGAQTKKRDICQCIIGLRAHQAECKSSYTFRMTSPLGDSFPRPRVVAAYLLKIITLALIYHLAARLGLVMAYVQINTSPVWPPTGIALAALLIFGYSLWPGISLGVLAGSLLTGAPLGLALGMTLGNTLEALVGAYLLKRFFDFHNPMDRIRDVVGLASVSVLSTMISATLGPLALIWAGQSDWAGFGALWSTWWIGDLLGALVVAPALLVWFSSLPVFLQRRQVAEGLVLTSLLILVTWYVFAGKPFDGILHQALIYMVFPFIIWAALRLGQRGATAAIAIVSGIAIWGTVAGLGPFSLESKNESLVLLQTFMAVVSLTALILAAVTMERGRAEGALQRRAEELGTLNDSSRTFLDNFAIASIYQTICRLAVERLGLDAAWIESPIGDSGQMWPYALYGISAEELEIQKRKWENDSHLPVHSANHIQITDISTRPGDADPPYSTIAAYPMIFSSRTIGVLKLLSRGRNFFTKDKQLLIQSYTNLAVVAVQNALLFDEVQATNRQLHALSQRLMKAQEDERLHLSRELHDESGQLLAALTVQFGLLERDAPSTMHAQVSELKKAANSVQDNLHRLAVNLRPASLDHLGLMTALQQFIREFSRQNGIRVEFEALGMQDKRLSIEIETAVFRTVQEALANVVLHAQATRVDVLLSLRDGQISAIVEDDGVGFVPAAATTEEQLGLFGMRERVEMLGGSLAIESSLGTGTTVRAQVPLP